MPFSFRRLPKFFAALLFRRHIFSLSLCVFCLLACAPLPPRVSVDGHLHAKPEEAADDARSVPALPEIPQTVSHVWPFPGDETTMDGKARKETYSVVAREVPVRDLLFALARDANLNMDIHPELSGQVTMNALDQTLPQLLRRIARQVDLRFELEDGHLSVFPDTPFLRHYKVDYVNMSRQMSGTVAASSQISSGEYGEYGATAETPLTGMGSHNASSTRVENLSRHQFWESLERNIRDILRETDKVFPAGAEGGAAGFSGATARETSITSRAANRESRLRSERTRGEEETLSSSPPSASRASSFREAAAVMMHPESGLVTVRATGRQHERIQEFIARATRSARRQVMIEATIVEVELADGYQQGIEWSRVWENGQRRFGFSPTNAVSGATPSPVPFVLDFSRMGPGANALALTLNLLESFGTTKVLSSPKLSVLNNQTALLKVVENVVYFSIKADVTAGNSNSNPIVAYTSTPQTVSVGLVMSVTPQIGDNDSVILNVRPTVSSIAGMVKDPNPDIPAHVANEIPQIRTREIESVLRLASGEIAVLGGLMEDRVDRRTGRVPFLGGIPLLGEAVTSRNDAAKKSELVIFMRPIVLRDSDAQGNFPGFDARLPNAGFWKNDFPAAPFSLPPSAKDAP
ncbi:MAG: type II and III secretion system protein [Zoogloeaceae bacterium]|jgi:general secretion pathway protein D|nr:type II and III secretion system protein [Zoogloeaceae bacterium]